MKLRVLFHRVSFSFAADELAGSEEAQPESQEADGGVDLKKVMTESLRSVNCSLHLPVCRRNSGGVPFLKHSH